MCTCKKESEMWKVLCRLFGKKAKVEYISKQLCLKLLDKSLDQYSKVYEELAK